jgi:2-dehydropantoate 2-reductase
MKAAILGCGAMGTVLGAFMTKNGQPSELVDNYAAHVKALNEKGAHIVGKVDMTVKVKAILPEQMEGIYDIIYLMTKQTANDTVLPALLPHLSDKSTVCTLQNGVPEPFVARHVGQKRTVGGTVLWGATFVEPGVSELTQDVSKQDHLFDIGELDGSIGDRIQQVAKVLNFMGPTHVSDSLMQSRWGKLINNACMSGMSAACGCIFGDVLDNPKALACLCYIGREVKQCCEASGYTLPILLGQLSPDPLALKNKAHFDESRTMFLTMYEGLRTAKASMLQDLEKDKITEVDMINGYVCSTGKEKGIKTPFNDTVVDIVHKIEQKKLPLSMDNLKYFTETLFDYGK